MNFNILQNITLSILSILGSFGLIILYWKVWKLNKDLKKINNEIENKILILNKLEINDIKSDHDFDINFKDNKKEKRDKKII